MDIFKEASKLKLRFVTPKGLLSIEQLWDLSQKELDVCIRNLSKVIKKNEDDNLSFLDDTGVVNSIDQLSFDILKDVYLTKKREVEEAKNALEVKQHNQKILELIAEKKEQGLKDKSIEELEKLLK
ncbi:MAG TPA: hypothetical protein VIK84_05720 [Haloplasmataceae bacterium]